MTPARAARVLTAFIWTIVVLFVALLAVRWCEGWAWGGSEQAVTCKITTYRGRISSYHPGKDGLSGTNIPGVSCLGLPSKWKDYKEPYPWPVCAMRAGCEKGSPRFGDLAMVELGTWKTWCVILDSGPWNAINENGDMVTASPKSKYKGVPPDGFHWRSIIDIASPSKGYPSGGDGEVKIIHFLAGVKARKLIVSGNLK